MSLPRNFPAVLSELHRLEFDYADGEGIDFEPYEEFTPRDDVQRWFKAWTGNQQVECDDYLIFGQDGTGGYVAIWPVRDGKSLVDQPIVFFGSEGEIGVIAQNFSDYLWLLGSNIGPYEAVAYPDDDRATNDVFLAFANAHATTPRRKVAEIIEAAQSEFPTFEESIHALCR
jgi:hypothetical protein